MKKIWKFLTGRFLWLNILLLIIAIVVVIKLALVFTDIYSHHGEQIVVPDLTNMQVDEAKKKLKKIKLKLVIVDSLYKNNLEPGSIVSQTPKAGSTVKRKRKIKLVVTASTPEKVDLQRGSDLSLRQAIQLLMSKGLEVGELKFRYSRFSNLVLGFEIEGEAIEDNIVLEKGSVVDIVVGKENYYYTVMPRLTDKTKEDAVIQLLMSGLNVGNVVYTKNVKTLKDSTRAVVYKQSIFSGNKVTPGSKVDIFLTRK